MPQIQWPFSVPFFLKFFPAFLLLSWSSHQSTSKRCSLWRLPSQQFIWSIVSQIAMNSQCVFFWTMSEYKLCQQVTILQCVVTESTERLMKGVFPCFIQNHFFSFKHSDLWSPRQIKQFIGIKVQNVVTICLLWLGNCSNRHQTLYRNYLYCSLGLEYA